MSSKAFVGSAGTLSIGGETVAKVKSWKVDGDWFQLNLERLYRKYVGRKPPGSNRTARLRKKRQKALLKWHSEYFVGWFIPKWQLFEGNLVQVPSKQYELPPKN